jgi:hypothetical protein
MVPRPQQQSKNQNQEYAMGYGKAKYGSDVKFQKTGKPGKGPGDNVIRIMPPMHSLGDEGKWAVYYTTHWGYAGISRSDATKVTVRPFRCIEDKDRRSGMVRQACPECENFRAKEKEATAYEAALKAKGMDDKAVKADPDMKAFDLWLQQHAPERKWYINVMYKDRSFGDYKINHKTHKKGIDSKIAELLDNQQIDALDLDQGVWFNIKRLGDGFSVPDVVEVVMRPGERKGSLDIELAPLTPEEQARGLKECRDLATLGGTLLSEEQIYALVQSDASPEAVDKIFGAREAQVSRQVQAADREEEEVGEVPPPAAVRTAPQGIAATGTVSAPAITDEMRAKAKVILDKKAADAKAAVEAQNKAAEAARRAAAAVSAAKAAEKAAVAPAPAAAEAPAQNPLDMNDEDFLKFFNSQQPA